MFFQLLFEAFKSCPNAPEMVDLQLEAPNVEVCVCVFQLLFETFKRCQDVSEMVDLQLGAPTSDIRSCSVVS